MGIFDFLKKKSREVLVFSPFKGKVVMLEDVPDEAFAKRMIGDGIAILPRADIVKNALASKVDVFKTNHALAYEIGEFEIIVHIGIETVSLKGEGFRLLVENGMFYPIETDIVKVDRAFIEEKGLSIISPIVSPTMHLATSCEILAQAGQEVDYGDPLLKFTLK